MTIVPDARCPSCGAAIVSTYRFCNRCGAAVAGLAPQEQVLVQADQPPIAISGPGLAVAAAGGPPVSSDKPTGASLAAFVAGMVGLASFLVLVPAVAGLVIAVIALVGLRGKRSGRGLAIAGAACSSVGIALFAAFLLSGASVPPTSPLDEDDLVVALERLHARETVFHSEFNHYCDDLALLEYEQPRGVVVAVVGCGPTWYAAEAYAPEDADRVYNVTHEGVVRSGRARGPGR